MPHALFVWHRPFTTDALVRGVSRLPSYRWENGASKGNSRAVSLTAPPCTRHCLWVTYVGWDVCAHGRIGKQDPPGNQPELFPKFFSWTIPFYPTSPVGVPFRSIPTEEASSLRTRNSLTYVALGCSWRNAGSVLRRGPRQSTSWRANCISPALLLAHPNPLFLSRGYLSPCCLVLTARIWD